MHYLNGVCFYRIVVALAYIKLKLYYNPRRRRTVGSLWKLGNIKITSWFFHFHNRLIDTLVLYDFNVAELLLFVVI